MGPKNEIFLHFACITFAQYCRNQICFLQENWYITNSMQYNQHVFITSNLRQTSDSLALSSGRLRHSIAMAANSLVFLLSSPLTGHTPYSTLSK